MRSQNYDAGRQVETSSARVPPDVHDFIALFNRGEFWESHEVLEGLWLEGRSDFLQGLILVASAWVHVGRGNPRGIVAQIRKAEQRLARYRPAYLGVDVDGLLAHIERARVQVAHHPDTPPDGWSGLLPPPHLRISPALLRGDEVELGDS